MVRKGKQGTPRVGIWLDLDWGLRREFEVYAGSQKFGDERGWKCILDPALEHSLFRKPGAVPYDGVLGRVSPAIAKAAKRAGVPVVNVWLNSPVENVPGVFNDFEDHGRLVAEHLLARGLREFGYLGYRRLIDCQLQMKGFSDRVRQERYRCKAFRFPENLVTASKRGPGWQAFLKGLSDWVDSWKPPIGVYVCEDFVCRFLIDMCRSKGLHVPVDVAIVSSGNETLMCESPAPSISSVDEGHMQKGYQAAALLERLMKGKAAPAEPLLVPAAELVGRSTSDLHAADDSLVARALRFISENGHQAISVPDVASVVAVTRRTLERRFRASLGRSVAAEITRLRVERAKRRLVETDMALKEVALDSGFSTANHFSKVFARVEGVSPSSYRMERQRVVSKRGS